MTAFSLPLESVNVYRAGPSPELEAAYLASGTAVLCVHPQLLETRPDDPYLARTAAVGERRPDIRVAPSSSTRTLYVLDADVPHALKVHFPFRISRYGRRMRDEVVEQAVAVSRELEAVAGELDDRFAFMREVLGITHREEEAPSARAAGRGEHWGYLVRETTPYPPAPPGESRFLVPGFALYGRDARDPATEPLLWTLLGDADPRAFVLESILLPVLRHWVACFRRSGFILEPHAQNVLLEVDGGARICRVVHRDLNVGIDMRRRRDVGAPELADGGYNRMESGAFASIAYDRFMGGHFFDRVVGLLLERFPHLVTEDVRGPCREEFRRLFPDHEHYLPRTVHYFSEERDQYGKPRHTDTGVPPVWRP